MRNFVYKVFSMNFEVLEYVMMVKWMVGKSDIDHVCVMYVLLHDQKFAYCQNGLKNQEMGNELRVFGRDV